MSKCDKCGTEKAIKPMKRNDDIVASFMGFSGHPECPLEPKECARLASLRQLIQRIDLE